MYDYYIYESDNKNLMLYRRNKRDNKIEYMIDPQENLEKNCFFGSFIELLLFKNSDKHDWSISTLTIKTLSGIDNFTYIGDLND